MFSNRYSGSPNGTAFFRQNHLSHPWTMTIQHIQQKGKHLPLKFIQYVYHSILRNTSISSNGISKVDKNTTESTINRKSRRFHLSIIQERKHKSKIYNQYLQKNIPALHYFSQLKFALQRIGISSFVTKNKRLLPGKLNPAL